MLNAASKAMDDQLDKLKLERERVREEERMLEEKYRYFLATYVTYVLICRLIVM